MPLSSSLKVQRKSASLFEINEAQRQVPYLGRYHQWETAFLQITIYFYYSQLPSNRIQVLFIIRLKL